MIRQAPKALLHDHLDGGLRPATVLEIAGQIGYDGLPATDVDELATLVSHRGAQRLAGALPRAVRAHRRGDADPRGAAPRGLRMRGGPGRRLRWCTPRCGSLPSCTSTAGCPSTRSSTRCWPVSPTARRPARPTGRPIMVRCLVTAMRHAARSREIAELAIRFRDKGVVGFDIAGAEAGYPPTRHLDAFEYMREQQRALHDSCR